MGDNQTPSSADKVRGMYEDIADSYAQMMDEEINLPVYKDVLKRLSDNISDLNGPLLDTACGSGHMLHMYSSQFDPERPLIGSDISPRMVQIAQKRMGEETRIFEGDMRALPQIETESLAAVLNFFAIHHTDLEGIGTGMREWYRVLKEEGRLVLAAWEGQGSIDYGEESDIIAFRYSDRELLEIAEKAGFIIDSCSVEPVEDFPMDALYLECRKS